MSKARLEDAYFAHSGLLEDANEALKRARSESALQSALDSLASIDGHLKYVKRWGNGAERRPECFRIVFHLAPLLAHEAALDAVCECLRTLRSLDRADRDALLEDARDAQALLATCRDAREATRGGVDITTLASEEVDAIEQLRQVGQLAITSDDVAYLAGDMKLPWRGKCSQCGALVRGAKARFFSEHLCPNCGATSMFVIVERSPAFSRGE